MVGRALVHDGGGAVGERSVDDVAVAGDPADVGGAPVDVLLRLQVEDLSWWVKATWVRYPPVVCMIPLGLAVVPRGVQHVERMLGVERLREVVGAMAGRQLVPPVVAARLPSRLRWPVRRTTTTCSTSGHGSTASSTFGLQRDFGAAPVAAVRGDHHRGFGSRWMRSLSASDENPPNITVCGAPMPRAGQHGHRQLGDHRHVDGDPVTGFTPELSERVGEPGHHAQQLAGR